MRSFRVTTIVVLVTVVISLTLTGAASGDGNSENAQVCQQGGWINVVRSDGTSFENQGDCVSYAAQGGRLTTPTPPFPDAEALCVGYGGTFGHDDQLAGGTRSYLWTCNDLPADFPFPSGNDALAQRCFSDGGTLFAYNPGPGASTCFND